MQVIISPRARHAARRPKPLTEVGPGHTLLGNQVDALASLVGRDGSPSSSATTR
jgi:hypothetical protein